MELGLGERGQALYRDGKYREARAEFAAGFDVSGLPRFIFNMAECSRLVGDLPLAREQTSHRGAR